MQDERAYSEKTFKKAQTILVREAIMGRDAVEAYSKFVAALTEFGAQQKTARDAVEIPEKYLDPLMYELMSDPVKLPTCDEVMDRSVAERQIMSTDKCPFTNMPLKKEDLVSHVELKKEIEEWAAKNGIAL